jgi:hypothetical protein
MVIDTIDIWEKLQVNGKSEDVLDDGKPGNDM